MGRAPTIAVFAAKGSKAPAGKGFGASKQQPGQKGIAVDAPCPCGSGALYASCCAPYHAAPASVPSPEALLRSRYSAYAAKDPAYIADTTHPDSPEFTGSRTTYMRAVKGTMQRMDPLGLTLLPGGGAGAGAASEPAPGAAGASSGAGAEEEAFLTFRVKRRVRDPEAPKNPSEVEEVSERSRFVRVGGRWFYMDSTFPEEEEAAAAEAAKQEEAPKKKGFLPFFN